MPSAAGEKGPDYRSPEDRLPKLVTFGIVRWDNTWHVVALKTQGDRVLDRKLLGEEEQMGSEAQAYDRMRLEVDTHWMRGEDVFGEARR